MIVGGGGQSPFLFPNTTLGGSFGDQSFSLVANGDAPVTMTLLSCLPADDSGLTIPGGQEGLTAERLTSYAATSPPDIDQILLSFYATATMAFPIELDAGIGISGSINDAMP